MNGRVIIGNGGAEFGVRGYVSAYDADTGELDWRFYTVPGNPADGFESEHSRTRQKPGRANGGSTGAVAPSGTRWPTTPNSTCCISVSATARRGTEMSAARMAATTSICPLLSRCDPTTGEYVWHYQTTPGDTWDFTATQHMILADLEIGGKLAKC